MSLPVVEIMFPIMERRPKPKTQENETTNNKNKQKLNQPTNQPTNQAQSQPTNHKNFPISIGSPHQN